MTTIEPQRKEEKKSKLGKSERSRDREIEKSRSREIENINTNSIHTRSQNSAARRPIHTHRPPGRAVLDETPALSREVSVAVVCRRLEHAADVVALHALVEHLRARPQQVAHVEPVG